MTEDPYLVLALAPTLDAAKIKRAYFAAIAKSPPHVDATAFRRVRQAFEALLDDDARVLAFLRAPIDERSALAAFEACWAERLEAAPREAASSTESPDTVRRFIDRIARLEFADFVGAADGSSGAQ